MRVRIVLLIAGLVAVAPAFAQDPSAYKVDFNIRDSSGAVPQTSRHYTMLISANGKGNFRVGAKVPYATGSFSSGQAAVTPLVSTQYNYADVGVNIDTPLRDVNGKLELNADLEVSSLVQHEKGGAANAPNPTISQSRISLSALIDPGRPAMVASVDDPVTLRKFDVEVTVTKTN